MGQVTVPPDALRIDKSGLLNKHHHNKRQKSNEESFHYSLPLSFDYMIRY